MNERNESSASHADHEHHKDENGHGDHGEHDHESMIADFRLRFFVSLGLTVPVVVLSAMLQELVGLREVLRFPGDSIVQLVFATAIYFYGGWPFLKGTFEELGEKQPGMMTLIGVAITTAFVYSAAVALGLPGKSFFWELATLIDVMLVGHWIEMRSVQGASRALEELAKLMPTEAHRLDDSGDVHDVSIDEVSGGDRLLVKPGEKIPADGVVVDGESSVNEALLTGESEPVAKSEGDEVIGGAVNGNGSLTIEVSHTGDESFLSQVVEMVRKAQESKSRTQDLANRAAVWLTGIALTGGAVTLAVWLLLVGRDFTYSLERTVTVMVITCPHALGLAVPLVVAVSTSLAARNGLLIRDRAAFERAREVTAILFDKTGTLTHGEFGVDDVATFGDLDRDELLSIAGSLEGKSEHPIAQAIADETPERLDVDDFEAITGKGVRGRVDGREVAVLSPGAMEDRGYDLTEHADAISGEGKTVVHVLVEDEWVGSIALADRVREESKEAIAALKEAGIRCMMLTGDNERVAKAVADEVGIDEVFAEILPDEKADKVKEVQERGFVVAMTGDGVNDAPALAQADVGIAVGAGTDVAVETADIVLVDSNPKDVEALLRLARSTYRKMVQNLWWASGYNIVAIPLAAGVLSPLGIVLSPAVGAVLMSVSTVIVAVNARLLGLDD